MGQVVAALKRVMALHLTPCIGKLPGRRVARRQLLQLRDRGFAIHRETNTLAAVTLDDFHLENDGEEAADLLSGGRQPPESLIDSTNNKRLGELPRIWWRPTCLRPSSSCRAAPPWDSPSASTDGM